MRSMKIKYVQLTNVYNIANKSHIKHESEAQITQWSIQDLPRECSRLSSLPSMGSDQGNAVCVPAARRFPIF